MALLVPAAETLTLTDGTTVVGDVVKFDDNGLLLRAAGDVYKNFQWANFSQEALKQLAANPKLNSKNPTVASLVEPFIEPDASQRPPKAEIRVNPVTRPELPKNPSLFGGLVASPVGWFILLVLYLANLYAAFEVAVIRGRSFVQVIGLSAVAPVIGPIVFLILPIPVEAPPAAVVTDAATPGRPAKSPEEIQITEASWRKEEKKLEAQVFARGKFTFNRRFVETKFAGYIGEPKGDAKKFAMQLKTAQGEFAIVRIAQVGATDVIFEAAGRGPITVPLADILEIKLIPQTA